jgi:hypothetical protein
VSMVGVVTVTLPVPVAYATKLFDFPIPSRGPNVFPRG